MLGWGRIMVMAMEEGCERMGGANWAGGAAVHDASDSTLLAGSSSAIIMTVGDDSSERLILVFLALVRDQRG